MLNLTRSLSRSSIAALLLGMGLGAAQADNLSAPAAEEALAGGALAWDVRSGGEVLGLPGALRVDAAALRAWLQAGDLAALQAAVSQAGIDLSRDTVVYGEAGDVRAQALVESLQALSRGRVHWLVGGAPEWAMSGRSLQALQRVRPPVPQYLVAHTDGGTGQMASAALRGDALQARLALR